MPNGAREIRSMNEAKRRIKIGFSMKRILIMLFIAAFLVYFLSSSGDTPYNYFTRLSHAFLTGHLSLAENPPWLNELIPTETGRFFVPYPPMPALLALPIVALLGTSFPQQIIAHLLGAGFCVFMAWTTFLITKERKKAIWIGLLAAFGNIIWFLAAVGSSWYLGQVTAAFFLAAALCEFYGKRRVFLTGLLVGGAYLSRIHTVTSVFFFAFLMLDRPFVSKKNLISLVTLFLGLAPFLLFNALYNYARFRVFWDKAYAIIPGVLNEPWYTLGLVHPSYIPRRLKIIFTALPKLIDKFPYFSPTNEGLAIWFTTPAFILTLKSKFRSKEVVAAIITIVLISTPILMHGTTGFAQFGYRFAMDFYPFLFLLLIYALPKKLGKLHWSLLLISILVNLWGVLINKYGLV